MLHFDTNFGYLTIVFFLFIGQLFLARLFFGCTDFCTFGSYP